MSSCHTDYKEQVEPKIKLNRIEYTSIKKEPHLTSILSKATLRTSGAKSDSNVLGITDIDTDRFIKILQRDSTSYVYSFAVPETATKSSFINLVLRQVPGGYLGSVIQYEAVGELPYKENGLLDFTVFTGTIKRYDLDGRLLRTNEFANGKQVDSNNARLTTVYCVESAEWDVDHINRKVDDTSSGGYGLNGELVLVLDIYVTECENNADDKVAPGTGGYYGGGTYIPGDPAYGGGGSNTPSDPASGGGIGGGSSDGSGDSFSVVVVSPPLVIAPSVWELNELIENKPFALYGKDIPCELVRQWMELAKHKVDQDLQAKVYNIVHQASSTSNTLLGIPTSSNYVGKVLDIDNAYSSVVNMDYFSVKVTQLPIINGQRLTPDQLLYKIRTDMDSFIRTRYSEFSPLVYGNIDDRILWNSTAPRGAVVNIDIGGPDNGSVIVSKVTPNSWIFSTIKDPVNGLHPVSGNREFGYTSNSDGSYTFYTKGVDRITDPLTNFTNYITSAPIIGNDGVAFEMADLLWESFQKGIANYVNQPNAYGQATIIPSTQYRPNWVKVRDVRDGIKPLSTLSNDCN